MSGDHKTVINGIPSQYVKLNVGGHLFQTTIATLTSKPDTMLEAMFSGRMEVLTDSEGKFHFVSLKSIVRTVMKSHILFSIFVQLKKYLKKTHYMLYL